MELIHIELICKQKIIYVSYYWCLVKKDNSILEWKLLHWLLIRELFLFYEAGFVRYIWCTIILWKEGQRGDGCGKGTRAVRRAAMSPQRDVTRWGLGSAGAGVMGWGIGDGLQCLSWHIYVQSFGQSMFVFNNKWMHHFGINLFPLLSPDFP